MINMIDALVAVLSMQNAIMNAKGFELKNGFNELSSYTSAVIFAAIVFITIRSMLSNRE